MGWVAARYLSSLAVAVVVALSLFYLMQHLIASGAGTLPEEGIQHVIRFVRIRQAPPPPAPERPQLPNRERPTDLPPTNQVVQGVDTAQSAPQLGLEAVGTGSLLGAPATSVQMRGGAQVGTSVEDTDAVPLLRVQPAYPRRAAQDGIEGWVRIRFSIGATGQVMDPVVVDARPANVFERQAIAAIKKWKYRPKLVAGRPVERHGMLTRLVFKLER